MEKDSRQAAIMACMDRMHRLHIWRSPAGLSPGEGRLLALICQLEREQAHAAVGDLCRETGMKSASVSRLMNALEQRGLIVRAIDPRHRRHVLVSATETGRALDKVHQREIDDYWDAVFARVPEADVEELLRIWGEILDGMEAVLSERRTAPKEADT